MRVWKLLYFFLSINISIWKETSTLESMYVCMYVCMYDVSMYDVSMYVCIYVCIMYVCI